MASGCSYHPYDQDNQALTTTEFAGEQEQGSLLDITRKSRQPNQKIATAFSINVEIIKSVCNNIKDTSRAWKRTPTSEIEKRWATSLPEEEEALSACHSREHSRNGQSEIEEKEITLVCNDTALSSQCLRNSVEKEERGTLCRHNLVSSWKVSASKSTAAGKHYVGFT
ncbi:hypothetical protein HN011_003947 [Eciton burchellii]|nr:hypothetical protein HN011_003947 [Eciton burchellii]